MTSFLAPLKLAMMKVKTPPFGTALRDYCYGIDPKIDALWAGRAAQVARTTALEARVATLEESGRLAC